MRTLQLTPEARHVRAALLAWLALLAVLLSVQVLDARRAGTRHEYRPTATTQPVEPRTGV